MATIPRWENGRVVEEYLFQLVHGASHIQAERRARLSRGPQSHAGGFANSAA